MHGLWDLLCIDSLNNALDDAFLSHKLAVAFIILIGYELVVYLEDIDGDVLLNAQVALQWVDDIVALPEHLHVFAVLLLEHDSDDFGNRQS